MSDSIFAKKEIAQMGFPHFLASWDSNINLALRTGERHGVKTSFGGALRTCEAHVGLTLLRCAAVMPVDGLLSFAPFARVPCPLALVHLELANEHCRAPGILDDMAAVCDRNIAESCQGLYVYCHA